MALALANMALWHLVDNTEAEEADDFLVTCEGEDCAALMTEDEYADRDGLCPRCYAACHFTCTECGKEYPEDDRSEEFPKLCQDCGDAKHGELVEELKGRLDEVLGEWDGDEGELDRLRKLVAFARKLSR
jgi:hypothetical protein